MVWCCHTFCVSAVVCVLPRADSCADEPEHDGLTKFGEVSTLAQCSTSLFEMLDRCDALQTAMACPSHTCRQL